MGRIIKIKLIGLSKLNNAEYTHFMGAVKGYAEVATAEKLGVEPTLLDKFKENILLLTDAAKQARVHNETQNLLQLSKDRVSVFRYLLSFFKMERKSPVEVRRKAATELFNATKTYMGSEKLPVRQLTQTIESLVLDLEKPEHIKNIRLLGLFESLQELKTVNESYKTLAANRTESQLANPLDNAKKLRKEVDEQYDEITTRGFVSSVANPSEEASKFVASVNKLIDEVNIAYKQRRR